MHIQHLFEASVDSKTNKLKALHDAFAQVDDPKQVQDKLADILSDILSAAQIDGVVSRVTGAHEPEDLDVDQHLFMKKLEKLGLTVDNGQALKTSYASHHIFAFWDVPKAEAVRVSVEMEFRQGGWNIFYANGVSKPTKVRIIDAVEVAKFLDDKVPEMKARATKAALRQAAPKGSV
jgi:hypothetical protein